MKILTPEGAELMSITSVEMTPQGIVIGGTIMGALPMKGLIVAVELKAGRKFVTMGLVWRALKMLFGRSRAEGRVFVR
jgi:hypothetical protein